MAQVLLIKSTYHDEIVDDIRDSAIDVLKSNNITYDEVAVPGVFEIPAAIGIALDSVDYEGILCIGCTLKHDKTLMHKYIYEECVRGINDFATHYSFPIGMGVIYCEKAKHAKEIANDSGQGAATSVLEMMKLKRQFNALEDNNYVAKHKHN